MAANLTNQVREIAHVVRPRPGASRPSACADSLPPFRASQTKSVARGNLSNSVTVDVQGEMLDLKVTGASRVSLAYTLPASRG